MIYTLSQYITNYLIKHKIINKEIEIYEYGFELMISTWIGTILVLIVGGFTNHFLDAIIYECVFRFTRVYTGGYHCKTYTRCILSYVFFFIIFVLLFPYLNVISFYSILFVCLINLFIVMLLCPVDHQNKKLSEDEKKYFKIKSIIRMLIIDLIVILLLVLNLNQIAIVLYSISVIDQLIILGYLENKQL
ncbi:MAG: accessory gene regulator ArgB-like protein [Thomasclavelia sp.]|uniref:accessory gene regulator ArgB-like protein n=1 Tax=Thomasclavelia sp. TaxID=3025757 RepID=UPI0039A039DB